MDTEWTCGSMSWELAALLSGCVMSNQIVAVTRASNQLIGTGRLIQHQKHCSHHNSIFKSHSPQPCNTIRPVIYIPPFSFWLVFYISQISPGNPDHLFSSHFSFLNPPSEIDKYAFCVVVQLYLKVGIKSLLLYNYL